MACTVGQVCKGYATQAARAPSKKSAEAFAEDGYERARAVFVKSATAVEGLKDLAVELRRLPVVDPVIPTVMLPCRDRLISKHLGGGQFSCLSSIMYSGFEVVAYMAVHLAMAQSNEFASKVGTFSPLL